MSFWFSFFSLLILSIYFYSEAGISGTFPTARMHGNARRPVRGEPLDFWPATDKENEESPGVSACYRTPRPGWGSGGSVSAIALLFRICRSSLHSRCLIPSSWRTSSRSEDVSQLPRLAFNLVQSCCLSLSLVFSCFLAHPTRREATSAQGSFPFLPPWFLSSSLARASFRTPLESVSSCSLQTLDEGVLTSALPLTLLLMYANMRCLVWNSYAPKRLLYPLP